MPLLLVILGFLSLMEAVVSLRDGFRFRRMLIQGGLKSRWARPPQVSLIIPCRGVDPGLELNLEAFFRQQYSDIQILLVTGDRDDPCFPILEETAARFPAVRSQILLAGVCSGRSQKVHNLLYALHFVRRHDEVLAFGDSDVRPDRDWLAKLVEPLSWPGVGASTGFRWYLPRKANFASRLRSAWNAGILSLLSTDDSPFAWGGAMAIRRPVFQDCGIEGRWVHALSDDYALSRAVHDAGLKIAFQPGSIGFSHEDCSLKELMNWSFRQMAITRVYNPKLWTLALISQFINSLFLWVGSLALLVSATIGQLGMIELILLATILLVYGLGIWKSWLRLEGLRKLFPEQWEMMDRFRFSYLLSGPLTSVISLAGLIRSLFSREIEWRGLRYRMVSPDRTQVISR